MGGSGQKGVTMGLFIFSKHLKADVENEKLEIVLFNFPTLKKYLVVKLFFESR